MRTIIITGANRGIGLELARAYHANGDKVIAAVRTSSDELDKLGVEIHENVDVGSDQSVADFTAKLDGRNIDILFNNAGILTSENLDDMNYDRIRHQFEINALGPLRVTCALIPQLARGAKVAIVSSRVGSISDNTGSGNYGYRMSKIAVNMAAKNLSIDLAGKDIGVYLFHPGYVATEMVNFRGTTPADVAAKGLIDVLDNLTMAETGTFWHAEGYQLSW